MYVMQAVYNLQQWDVSACFNDMFVVIKCWLAIDQASITIALIYYSFLLPVHVGIIITIYNISEGRWVPCRWIKTKNADLDKHHLSS